MYGYSLYGVAHITVSFDNWWCYIRIYLLSVALGSLYHSYLIQACFRLFRIVFYRNRQLQKFKFIFCLILIQWLIDFLIFMPSLLLHYYEYVPQNYFCQVSYTNLPGIMSVCMVMYYFPMIAIGIIYYSIIYYMKKGRDSAILQNRQHTNQRELLVLRRILIPMGVLFMVIFPSAILYFWYIFSGYLYPLIYQFQWFSFTLAISVLPLVTALLTPQLRKLLKHKFKLNRRTHPVITIQQYELQRTNTAQVV